MNCCPRPTYDMLIKNVSKEILPSTYKKDNNINTG